ncbi:MAG TPA: hypothetical protein DEH78_31885 [Solibacterales bacterium]|nr:hypothetical protein [Bryobacterales bacterium]
MQALVKGGLDVRRKRVVVAGSGPLLLAVAAYLRRAGARVLLIVEQAPFSSLLRFGARLTAPKLAQAAALQFQLLGIPYKTSAWVERAEGKDRLESVVVKGRRIPCDYLAIGYGLAPNTELAAVFRCELRNGVVHVDDYQRTSTSTVFCAGEPTGIGGVDLSLIEGEIAGYAAAGDYQKARTRFAERAAAARFALHLNRAFALRPELRNLPDDGTLVCRCEDVSYGVLKNETNWREAKLQHRCGMGPCQGRVCGPATEFLFGWHHDSVRPPVFPARVETLIGEPHS